MSDCAKKIFQYFHRLKKKLPFFADPVVYFQQKGRPVCSTHCAQKKLMHTIASWIRNQCHFSSSAECFEFVRTSFFTHKSFDHYSLTQKRQSAFSFSTQWLELPLLVCLLRFRQFETEKFSQPKRQKLDWQQFSLQVSIKSLHIKIYLFEVCS